MNDNLNHENDIDWSFNNESFWVVVLMLMIFGGYFQESKETENKKQDTTE